MTTSLVTRTRLGFSLVPLALVCSLFISSCGPLSPTAQDATRRFVGQVNGSSAWIGLVSNQQQGKLLAYVCQNNLLGEWFSGALHPDGTFDLTNASGAHLQGNVGDTQVQGTLRLSGSQLTPYTAPLATGNQGIYRVRQVVDGISYEGGWIVGSNGKVEGLLRRNDSTVDASHVDPRQAVVK